MKIFGALAVVVVLVVPYLIWLVGIILRTSD